MTYPEHLKYAKSHEWVEFLEDGSARIGMTDYAQDQMGDLVFVNLPEPEDEVTAGEAFGDVESVKAVSDVYSPVTGVVAEINEEMLDSAESINSDPYGAWMISISDIEDKEELMGAQEKEEFVKEKEF